MFTLFANLNYKFQHTAYQFNQNLNFHIDNELIKLFYYFKCLINIYTILHFLKFFLFYFY